MQLQCDLDLFGRQPLQQVVFDQIPALAAKIRPDVIQEYGQVRCSTLNSLPDPYRSLKFASHFVKRRLETLPVIDEEGSFVADDRDHARKLQ